MGNILLVQRKVNMATAIMRRSNEGVWFKHADLEHPEKHDIECRTGACWPSRSQPFTGGEGLTKENVMQVTYELVNKNPKEIICEGVHWATGYSYKAWRVEDSSIMNFIRGTGDHAFVYSPGHFRLRHKVDRSCYPL